MASVSAASPRRNKEHSPSPRNASRSKPSRREDSRPRPPATRKRKASEDSAKPSAKQPQKAEGLSLTPPVAGTGLASAPPATLGTGAGAAGQKFWEWTEQATDAGKEALAQASSWTSKLFATPHAAREESNGIIDSPNDIARGDNQEEARSPIDELMLNDWTQRNKNIETRQAVGSQALHMLRPQVRRQPSTLRRVLDNLNPHNPSSLNTALGLLATAVKVRFIHEDGTSHLFKGAAVEASRLGSSVVQETVEALGPIIAVHTKAKASTLGEPSFMYDLRRLYSPREAWSDEQLKLLSPFKPADTLEFFAEHTYLLEALIRGMSSDAYSDALPYFTGGSNTRKLQKRLSGYGDRAEQVVRALMSPTGLKDEQRHLVILRELLGQSKEEIVLGHNFAFYSIPYRVNVAISHLIASAKHGPSTQSAISPFELQKEVQKRKKRTARYAREQERWTMEGLVTGRLPYVSIKNVQEAVRQGNRWAKTHWTPKGKKLRNAAAPLETALYLELLYPSAKNPRAKSTSIRRIRLSNQSYRAIAYFVRSSGKMWDGAEISALYKLFRGVAPLMEITDLEQKKHLVQTAAAFRFLFTEWGSNSQTQANVELFEKSIGDDEAFYRNGKRDLKNAIKNGHLWMAEESALKREV